MFGWKFCKKCGKMEKMSSGGWCMRCRERNNREEESPGIDPLTAIVVMSALSDDSHVSVPERSFDGFQGGESGGGGASGGFDSDSGGSDSCSDCSSSCDCGGGSSD